METRTTEIAPGIHRLSTYVDAVAPPMGFTFNQFLIEGDEPFLFHTGMRQLFPLVSEAVDRIVGLDRLRWVSFGHIEADECGAMNLFLAASPDAQVIHGDLACSISLDDLCDRPPVRATDEPLDLGGHLLRFVPTPHVPHNWESGLWFDETTRTLLSGDLFTSLGDGPALVETSLVEAALIAEDVFHHSSVSPTIPGTLRALASLEPTTIACMHGSSFHGDGAAELRALADAYEGVLRAVPA
jgi:flavorubredoxin